MGKGCSFNFWSISYSILKKSAINDQFWQKKSFGHYLVNIHYVDVIDNDGERSVWSVGSHGRTA